MSWSAQAAPSQGAAVGRQGPTSVGPTSPFMDLKGYRGFVGLSTWSLLKPSLEKSGQKLSLQSPTPGFHLCGAAARSRKQKACPLPALLPGLWATRPEKVAEVFQSFSPGSSASWCNEKLLFPPSFTAQVWRWKQKETLEQGERK